MASSKKPGFAFWTIVVVLVLLIPAAGYLGAYAGLVKPDDRKVLDLNSGFSLVVATYPGVGVSRFWRAFFRPANLLDRRLRPEVWHGAD